MKNKSIFLLPLILMSVLLLAGCMAMPAPTPRAETLRHDSRGFFAYATIPVKDFEPVGLVFTQLEIIVDSDGGISGQINTFQNLLREAQRLGAHAVINVTIDNQRDTVRACLISSQQDRNENKCNHLMCSV